jgi:hypothetical protein
VAWTDGLHSRQTTEVTEVCPAAAIPCLPEDQTFYAAARTLTDHKMSNYETALEHVAWAGALEEDADFKLASFGQRFRWQTSLDEL